MRQILLTHLPHELDTLYSRKAIAQLEQLGEVILNPFEHRLTSNDMLELAPQAEVIISEWQTGLDTDYLHRTKQLKAFVRSGVEILNVDFDKATEAGIIIANTPGLYTTPVVEMVLAFMISLAHNLIENHVSLQNGVVPERRIGFELPGKVLGIVGFGDIGRHLAQVVERLGVQVLTYDPYVSSTPPYVSLVSLNDLLASSDFVSVHAKLTPETRGLIGAPQIRQMKGGAFLINTARGSIVDELAVVEALESGHLAGAAFDVFASEPDFLASPLLEAPHVITTPHSGGFTRETFERQALATVQTVRHVLNGEVPHPEVHVVNKEVFKNPKLQAKGMNR